VSGRLPMTRVTVDDIIARFGPRQPAAGSAPASFRVAPILVTRDGLSTPEEMWLYTYFAGRGELRDRVPVHSGFVKELGRHVSDHRERHRRNHDPEHNRYPGCSVIRLR
jgi:hypothetical protein